MDRVLADVPRTDRCRCRDTPGKVAAKEKVRAAAESHPETSFGRFKDWLKK